jgi:DNA gyrase/topoisomerase IV subunit B
MSSSDAWSPGSRESEEEHATLKDGKATGGGRRIDDEVVEAKIKRYDPREHVLKRSGMYIGTRENRTMKVWVVKDETLGLHEVTFPPGFIKLFDEILVNAADNMYKTDGTTEIRVVINQETGEVSVWNNGAGVPVEMDKTEKMYNPELVFGVLMTSTNYDDTKERLTGGLNGFGAKLANIFSTKFLVETYDKRRGLLYKQTFRNNMTERDDPVIKEKDLKQPYTKITFYPDFSHFEVDSITDDMLAIMKRRVWDIAGTARKKLIVKFNGKSVKLKGFDKYAAQFLGSNMFHVEHDKTDEEDDDDDRDDAATTSSKMTTASTSTSTPKFAFMQSEDRWEVAAAASTGKYGHVSYVNSVCTTLGGTHVEYLTSQLVDAVRQRFTKKFKAAPVPTPAQIRNNIFMLVNARIVNPEFDTQTKTTLTTDKTKFGSTCTLTDAFIKRFIATSGIFDRLMVLADAKDRAKLRKMSGTKKARVAGIPKLDDANLAGGPKSSDCTLILTEGDSAKAQAVSGLTVVGRDRYGAFPLRGKFPNAEKTSLKSLAANKEVQAIVQIMGLKFGEEYTDTKKLRYGHILIMADQDDDGSHIKALVINFIHHCWPSLLKIKGFLQIFITPIVKVRSTSGGGTPFYTLPEYKSYMERLETESPAAARRVTVRYYKGLGTSTPAEIKEYFRDLPMHLLTPAFNDTRAARRVLKDVDDATKDDTDDVIGVKAPDDEIWTTAWIANQGIRVVSDDDDADTDASIRYWQTQSAFKAAFDIAGSTKKKKAKTRKHAAATAAAASASAHDEEAGVGCIDEAHALATHERLGVSVETMCSDLLRLYFRKEKENARKAIMLTDRPALYVNYRVPDFSVTDILWKELIKYSVMSNTRSIPSLLDGLKTSQRKILYGCIRRDTTNPGQEIRVAQLASYVAEATGYHHGETSLSAAIIKMAQTYPGSNNINLLHPSGQFGTRHENGDDAASPRYTFSRLEPIARAIFHPDDDQLLKRKVEDGDPVEPVVFFPVIPMVLVNGVDGIATGWSTLVPSYNPLDIIANLRRMLVGQRPFPMTPFWHGYTGIVKPDDDVGTRSRSHAHAAPTSGTDTSRSMVASKLGKRTERDSDTDPSDCRRPLDGVADPPKRYIVSGTAALRLDDDDDDDAAGPDTKARPKQSAGILDVTELPLRLRTSTYKSMLEGFMKPSDPTDKDKTPRPAVVVSFDEFHGDASVHFRIFLTDKGANIARTEPEAFRKLFGLDSTVTTTNLTLFDSRGRIARYLSPEHILRAYFPIRFHMYQRRRERLIANEEESIADIDARVRYIKAILSGELVIAGRPVDDVSSSIEALGIPRRSTDGGDASYLYLLRMPIISITKERVDALEKRHAEATERLEALHRTTPAALWTRDLDTLETQIKDLWSKRDEDRVPESDRGSKKIPKRRKRRED